MVSVITFEISGYNRYKLNKMYRKFAAKFGDKKSEELSALTLSKLHFYKVSCAYQTDIQEHRRRRTCSGEWVINWKMAKNVV